MVHRGSYSLTNSNECSNECVLTNSGEAPPETPPEAPPENSPKAIEAPVEVVKKRRGRPNQARRPQETGTDAATKLARAYSDAYSDAWSGAHPDTSRHSERRANNSGFVSAQTKLGSQARG